jgi:glyoxylase-like metal-dependent hydrolase (beta-lactamase superfamily II)/rhodanese-related sulfurtransferase
MYVEQFFVDGLGCASYLVGCESQGIAAVVDPERDVRRYIEAAQKHGLKITHIIETHLHADHVSGNTDLAARTGADIYIHEAAQAGFAHKALKDGDTLQLGGVRIDIRYTPGHTPESITLLVTDTTRAQEPWIALTGDLLFVGDVGRPDLVGAEAARGLAGDLYESLFNKMLKQDDALLIYPGHGAGSLCGRAIGSVRSSTLGFERKHNPALAPQAKESFVEYMTTNLPEQPGNHQRIKAMNRKGPKVLGDIRVKPLILREAIPYFQRGAALLDTRSKEEYVKLHIPGSSHLEANDQMSNRVGFVLDPDVPVVLLLENEADYEKVVLSLARVGYENVAGYLAGGISTWQSEGLPTTSGDVQDISPQDLAQKLASGEDLMVVDVREPWEFAQGHVPGAMLIPLQSLGGKLSKLDPEKPVAVICASGNRSESAAALLGQKGFKKVYNILNGMYGWEMAGLEISLNGR